MYTRIKMLALSVTAITALVGCTGDSGAAHQALDFSEMKGVSTDGSGVLVFSQDTYEPQVHFDLSGGVLGGIANNSGLVFDVENVGVESVQLFVSVYDDSGAFGTRSFNVAANSLGSFVFDLSGEALTLDTGMRDDPKLYDNDLSHMTWMWGSKQLDTAAIDRVEISMKSILSDRSIRISKPRVESLGVYRADGLANIFDEFGQYRGHQDAIKIRSVEDMHSSLQRERESFQANDSLTDRSRFGGWLNGPQLEATGYFRVEKLTDRWAIVDPEGYLYFSTGIDNMRMANTATMTGYDLVAAQTGQTDQPAHSYGSAEQLDRSTRFVASEHRASMFSWLPSENDPLAHHFGYRFEAHTGPLDQGETYSFYLANLERKYGDNYMEQWRDMTLSRQLSWGFTSLGNWADPSLYNNNRIPYVANGWILGDHKRVSSGTDYWGPLHDPYDPEFRESVRATVEQIASEVNGDPWCMGVFIDNELSWGNTKSDELQYGIVLNTLARSADESPAKSRFLELLNERYDSIDDLNAAWSENYSSWDELGGVIEVPALTDALIADAAILLEDLSSTFFRVINEELKAKMPNHLYLGARFADWGMTPEVIRGAAKHVDIVSYNLYTEGLAADNWEFLSEIDMPSIIGEFHFGSLESSTFHAGLVSSSSQEDRGRMFINYMNSVIDNPYFVGAHWFQYIDSPASGRAWDGENYNVGFVDIVDEPYVELVDATKQLNASLYERRYGDLKDSAQNYDSEVKE